MICQFNEWYFFQPEKNRFLVFVKKKSGKCLGYPKTIKENLKNQHFNIEVF